MRTAAEMVDRVPASARKDLLEWGPNATAEGQFAEVLRTEISPENLITVSPQAPALQDDRPVNEYFILRSSRSGRWRRWLKLRP